MSRSLILGAVLLVAIAAGCGGAAKTQAPNPRDARDHALLSSILGGIKTDLVSVRIGDPAKGWGKPYNRRRKFLYVTPKTTSWPTAVAEGWYALLIANAYQAQCREQRADCLLAFNQPGIEGMRMLPSHMSPPARVNARALARQIRSRFAKAGLHVSAISFERPYGLAPVITVTSDHPARAVIAFYKTYRSTALLGHLPIESALVQMVDGGRLFFISGRGEWLRPDLSDLQPSRGTDAPTAPTGPQDQHGP